RGRGVPRAGGMGARGSGGGCAWGVVAPPPPRGRPGPCGRPRGPLRARLPSRGAPRARREYPEHGTARDPSRDGQPVLKAENLHKRFGGLRATNDVSLTLHQGEILGIIGPNGAGKTTVFNLLSGFLAADQGSVTLLDHHGRWVSCKSPDAFAHHGLGRTFQIAKPFTGLSVLENIMLGAFIRTANRDEAEQIARRVAEQTDLTAAL